MMRRQDCLPIGIGAMMGAAMLWMVHERLSAGEMGGAGLAFVLTHVAIIGLALGAAGFGLGRRHGWIARLARHRPSIRHVGLMLLGALGMALVIHLTLSGATPWI